MIAQAGASIVERHLTHDRAARGPDHAASSDPTQFQRYIRLIREADVLRGAGNKRVLDIEQNIRSVSRQSLVVRRTLEAGNVLREEDLTVQRPGTGLTVKDGWTTLRTGQRYEEARRGLCSHRQRHKHDYYDRSRRNSLHVGPSALKQRMQRVSKK